MPTRNVNLTHKLERFVLQKVKSARHENASEVVRAALAEVGARGKTVSCEAFRVAGCHR
jgi:putative addiction module CopG family antidote